MVSCQKITQSLCSRLKCAQLSTLTRSFYTFDKNMQDTRPQGHRHRRYDHLKMMNYTMSVDEDKVEAVVRTHGLTYSDYDSKNALPKPWNMMKLLESGRFYSHHWPLDDNGRVFRDYAQLTSDRLTFLITSAMDFQKDMYNPKVIKSPLDIKIQGGYIGNTSLNSTATVLTMDGTELISNNINQVVSIDKTTRRPLPLPEWWKNKYAKSAEPHKALKVDLISKPDESKPFQIKVLRSDIDGNNHANWSSYVNFSMDAIYHFASVGVLKSFTDIDQMCLKRMELKYSGESFDDDTLNVFAWEMADKDTVAVHIYKEGNLLFQGKFLYFEERIQS